MLALMDGALFWVEESNLKAIVASATWCGDDVVPPAIRHRVHRTLLDVVAHLNGAPIERRMVSNLARDFSEELSGTRALDVLFSAQEIVLALLERAEVSSPSAGGGVLVA